MLGQEGRPLALVSSWLSTASRHILKNCIPSLFKLLSRNVQASAVKSALDYNCHDASDSNEGSIVFEGSWSVLLTYRSSLRGVKVHSMSYCEPCLSNLWLSRYDTLVDGVEKLAMRASQAHNAGDHAGARVYSTHSCTNVALQLQNAHFNGLDPGAKRAMEEAILNVNKAIKIEPGNPQAYLTGATLFLNTQQFAESLRHWDMAKERLEPNSPYHEMIKVFPLAPDAKRPPPTLNLSWPGKKAAHSSRIGQHSARPSISTLRARLEAAGEARVAGQVE